MHSVNGMAETLRAALAAPRGIELPGCYDVLSAMILERAGFEAVFMSGYGVAASLLGSPDIGLTSLVETSLMTKNLTSALRVPLVVDADNGYGNHYNAVRVVRELELAGAAAMVLEDQVFPKQCGHTGGKQVIPLDQYMRKLDCALEARQTPMCIVARTDAMSLDEGITRARRFCAAGADVVLIDGLPSREALERVAREVPGHKAINLIYGGKTPMLPSQELHDLGFKIVLYSTPALYTAAPVLFEAMRTLHETRDLNSISAQSISFRDFQQFIEAQYLQRQGSECLSRGAVSAARRPQDGPGIGGSGVGGSGVGRTPDGEALQAVAGSRV